jgi:competence protein ComEC
MHPFASVPVLRLLLPFCVGIVMQIFLPQPFLQLCIWTSVIGLLVFLFSFHRKTFQKFRWRWIYGSALGLFLVFYAMLLVFVYTEKNRPAFFGDEIQSASAFSLRLTEPLHEKEKSMKASAEVNAMLINNQWKPVTGKLIIYFAKSPKVRHLNYGDIIISTQQPQVVREPQNPGSFNYKRFLSFHGIYHQVYLDTASWTNTATAKTNILWATAYKLKAGFVKEIQQQIVSKNEVAVCSALLVGYEDYLDQELIDAYSSSGALHVLSVSGLHVGIIFLFLQWLLQLMDKRKWSQAIKNILIILVIWFYALLAGLAPSILRSAVMITMIIVGKWLKRDAYMLNTTLWSALILLHINPYMITEVGFQLSYLAVFGIVYLHQRFVALWTAPNKLLQNIWELTSVSLCAQLMTFPLGLLYFNQFPNLFLISNLLVIPISSLLMFSSIAAATFMWWPYVSFIFWKVSYVLAWLMNEIVLIVDKVPYSIITGVWISIGQTWIIYLMIGSALWFLMYKRKLALFIFFAFTTLFLCWLIADELKIKNQKKLMVYAIDKTTAVDIVAGRNHVFVAPQELINDKSKIRFNIQRKWYETGIKQTVHVNFLQRLPHHTIDDFGYAEEEKYNLIKVKGSFIQASEKIIFIPTQWMPHGNSNKKIYVDYIIITSRFKNKLSTLLKYVTPNKIIYDGSTRLKKTTPNESLINADAIYSVKEQGAFITDL